MHPVAVKCIKWAVGLFIVGGLTGAYGGNVLVALSDYAGVNANAGIWAFSVVISLMQWTLMPLGGSLVGAAVVIQTLAPYLGWVAGGSDQGDEVQGDEVQGDEVEGDEVEGGSDQDGSDQGDEVEGDEVRDSERA